MLEGTQRQNQVALEPAGQRIKTIAKKGPPLNAILLPSYTPRTGTLAEQMCEFFKDNADEELTRSDIALKFSVAASSIDNSLKNAIAAAVISTKNSEDMTRVWVAGPNLPAPSSFKRWLAKQGKTSAEGRGAPPRCPTWLLCWRRPRRSA